MHLNLKSIKAWIDREVTKIVKPRNIENKIDKVNIKSSINIKSNSCSYFRMWFQQVFWSSSTAHLCEWHTNSFLFTNFFFFVFGQIISGSFTIFFSWFCWFWLKFSHNVAIYSWLLLILFYAGKVRKLFRFNGIFFLFRCWQVSLQTCETALSIFLFF